MNYIEEAVYLLSNQIINYSCFCVVELSENNESFFSDREAYQDILFEFIFLFIAIVDRIVFLMLDENSRHEFVDKIGRKIPDFLISDFFESDLEYLEYNETFFC